jgi:hypothetical protein
MRSLGFGGDARSRRRRTGAEVRKYEGGRSLEAFQAYLAAGWRAAPQLPLMRSPYGPAGRLKGALITAGARLLDVHTALQGGGKVSWWMASPRPRRRRRSGNPDRHAGLTVESALSETTR